MIPARYLGLTFVVGYTLLTALLFAWQPLAHSPVEVPAEHFTMKKISEVLAAIAMVLMGFGLILGARFRFLEAFFGGLDRMYKFHKIFGIVSVWLILAHFALMPEFGPEEGYGAFLPALLFPGIDHWPYGTPPSLPINPNLVMASLVVLLGLASMVLDKKLRKT